MKVFVLLLTLSLASLGRSETLTILNWEDYLSEEVIEAWEERSGHEIKQIYFDNDEVRDSILLNHKEQIIDIAIVDESTAQIFGQKGMFLAISDYQNVPTLKGIDKAQQKICGDYSLPYMWGTFGITYRTDKISSPPTSWNFLFSPPEIAKGHIGLIDDFVDTIAPALFLMDKSINTSDEATLKKAFELTKQTLPNILTFSYGISFAESEEQRDKLYAALAYNGDQYTLNEKYDEEIWDYVVPDEGTIIWHDCLALRKDSPRRAIAFDFLNFIYDPKIAALNSENLGMATPVPEAKILQSEEFSSDSSVYPPDHVMANAQAYEILTPENILLRNRITSSLVKLHDAK